MTILNQLQDGAPLLLDGAMGTELERLGAPMDNRAWSASASLSHPELVRVIHQSYVDAGAEIHIVNSFAASRHVLDSIGLGDQFEPLNRRAVELCRETIEATGGGRRHWIAGSLSSFAEAADRSRLPRPDRLRANYADQATLLARCGVDLLVLEMLYDVEVSGMMIEAATQAGLPYVVGFTCTWGDDGSVETSGHKMGGRYHGAFGAVLSRVIDKIPNMDQAILSVMHSNFDVTEAALDIVRGEWTGPIAVYPNSGEFIMPNWQFDTVCEPDEFVDAACDWIGQGVAIVGGCCGLGPAHIRALAQRLDRLP